MNRKRLSSITKPRPPAEVYSHDPRLLEKLRRLAEKYPDQIVKKGPPDLHSAQTLRVGCGRAVQRRAPQGRQRTGQGCRVQAARP